MFEQLTLLWLVGSTMETEEIAEQAGQENNEESE